MLVENGLTSPLAPTAHFSGTFIPLAIPAPFLSTFRPFSDLQRATIASQAFYAEASEPQKNRSPWILKRLYEWSGRAKRREIIKHVQAALETSKDHEIEDDELEKLLVS